MCFSYWYFEFPKNEINYMVIIYCSQNPHYAKSERVQTFLNFTFSFRYFTLYHNHSF